MAVDLRRYRFTRADYHRLAQSASAGPPCARLLLHVQPMLAGGLAAL